MKRQPTDDHCPRCGGEFHCGATDVDPCPCGSVALRPALLAQLRAQYVGCLCLNCLRQLAIPASVKNQ